MPNQKETSPRIHNQELSNFCSILTLQSCQQGSRPYVYLIVMQQAYTYTHSSLGRLTGRLVT